MWYTQAHQPLPIHFIHGPFSFVHHTSKATYVWFSSQINDQHRRDLRWVLKLITNLPLAYPTKKNLVSPQRQLKMEETVLKQHPKQSYSIYLAWDNHPTPRLINSSPLIFPGAQNICKTSSYISSTAQVRRHAGTERSNELLKVKQLLLGRVRTQIHIVK